MKIPALAAIAATMLCPPPSSAEARATQIEPAAGPAKGGSAELRKLFDDEWSFRSREFGRQSTEEKTRRDFLPQVDEASQMRRRKAWSGFLERLGKISRSGLSKDERIDADVFKVIVEGQLAEQDARAWEMPFNSDTSFWSSLESGEGWREAADYEAYLNRLRQIPRYFDQQIANMRAGLKRGFSVPAITLRGRDASIKAYVTPDAEGNPLYKAFARMPPAIPAAERGRLSGEAKRVVSGTVVPAYAKLLRFMQDEYMPGARPTTSAADMPAGAAYYRAQARLYTTLDLPPEQIHRIGMEEVARISAEMEALKRKLGFSGTIAELAKSLKSDPRFVAKSGDELLWRTAYLTKRVDGRIGKVIGTLPRQRFSVRPVPAEVAPFYTSGRGGREACWMNTYDLPSRPLYALTALTLHECSPGHSLQTAIADEQTGRPRFRRDAYFSGYSEGWGLYAEWLGVGMGLYDSDYDEFGRLSYAMWRACRLVIDTGLHRYGWPREKAVAYLRDRTALSDHEIETEIDRYISWPGQALSYKLGELKIRELRSLAERRLGERFDEPGFHDAILGLGSVPLSVLDEQVRLWLEEASARPAAPSAER